MAATIRWIIDKDEFVRWHRLCGQFWAPVLCGLSAQTCDLRKPHMKKSNGVKSHDLGAQLTSPMLRIAIPSNRDGNAIVVFEEIQTSDANGLQSSLNKDFRWLRGNLVSLAQIGILPKPPIILLNVLIAEDVDPFFIIMSYHLHDVTCHVDLSLVTE